MMRMSCFHRSARSALINGVIETTVESCCAERVSHRKLAVQRGPPWSNLVKAVVDIVKLVDMVLYGTHGEQWLSRGGR